MGEIISDQELRRRLLVFNTVVPPVTSSTRSLLLKKLANLEKNQTKKNPVPNIMPPPKTRTTTNGTNESIMISSSVDSGRQFQHMKFNSVHSPRRSTRQLVSNQYRAPDSYDTSDSEVDTASLGRSILLANPKITSSSPKSNESSLMNVSNWTNANNADEDQNSYVSPETKKSSIEQTQKTEKIMPKLFDSKINRTSIESSPQKFHSSPITKTLSHADKAIQRWREKTMLEIKNKSDLINSSKSSSQNLRRSIQPTNQKYQRNHFTKNIQNTILLFIGFFVIIFGVYFISIQPGSVVLPSSILNSLCAKKGLQGSNCDTEQEKVQRLYNTLVSQVQDKYIRNQCDRSDIKPTVDAQTVFEYISTHENMPSREVEELVELFISIAKTYSDSPIEFDTTFKLTVQPNLPVACAIKQIFSNMFYLVTWLGIVALSVIGFYFLICYITTSSEKHKEEVNQLVKSTIDLLKEQAQNSPHQSYLPIIHIRDYLIPFNERQAKSKTWVEVVQYFTESESCVRSEVQEIDGEDFQVWRWVQPMSPGI